jgi:hypothetical protein
LAAWTASMDKNLMALARSLCMFSQVIWAC